MIKFIVIAIAVIVFIMSPCLRYTIFHPVLVCVNAVKDLYRFFRYKKYNEFKDFGRMTMYIANDSQPFGSGKTLNLVRYVRNVYRHFNGKKVWDSKSKSFVPQVVKIYSNIKLIGIPYIPLTSEQQIIEASELESDYIVQLFVLDEMGSQWNNRNWKNNLTEDLLNSILQQRKSKIAIIGTVQDYSLFDATLRKLTTNVYECSKLWRFLTLREFYAKDIERAQNNTELIICRSKFIRFATDDLYNSYDTTEKVHKLAKDVADGNMLTNQEILLASSGDTPELGSLTHVKRKYRKNVKR